MADEATMDKADLRLLQAIQEDASLAQAELGERAGVSPSQVSRRLARLRAAGILKSIVGLVDAERVGVSCAAFVRVRLRDHSEENVRLFRGVITRMAEATLCVAMTGEADYLVKIVARDLNHFQNVVQAGLLRCRAVLHVESSIVLECVKDTTELPLWL